jgi:pyrimidine deaminase RibD-like protein
MVRGTLITDTDFEHIRLAIDTARFSSQEDDRPRPKVGAVLVKDGEKLGAAFRGESGPGDHAEFGLLEVKLKHTDVAGGTLYTTLEPCTVRNPPKIPCVERISSRRLARVVIGMLDANQLICGKGIRHLRKCGIEIDLFPSKFVNSVEDQNREFIRDRELVEKVALSDATSKAGPLINPQFAEDLVRLDKSFKLESIFDSNTIFIIAGDSIVSEVLDRHTCGLLREAIDIRGTGHPFRRALIVSAKTWIRDGWFTLKCPAISIGGEAANEISKEWLRAAAQKRISPFPLSTGHGVYLGEPRPRAVLYGPAAADTMAAVETYIAKARGLKEFLANAWS